MRTEEKKAVVVSKYSYIGAAPLTGGITFTDIPYEHSEYYMVVLDDGYELCVSKHEYDTSYHVGETVSYETLVWEKNDYLSLFFFIVAALILIGAIVVLL